MAGSFYEVPRVLPLQRFHMPLREGRVAIAEHRERNKDVYDGREPNQEQHQVDTAYDRRPATTCTVFCTLRQQQQQHHMYTQATPTPHVHSGNKNNTTTCTLRKQQQQHMYTQETTTTPPPHVHSGNNNTCTLRKQHMYTQETTTTPHIHSGNNIISRATLEINLFSISQPRLSKSHRNRLRYVRFDMSTEYITKRCACMSRSALEITFRFQLIFRTALEVNIFSISPPKII